MYIFERDILHSLYWSFYFEKKKWLFLHFLMVVMEARITKDYINLFIVSNLISLSGLKKFLCNKFRNEKILIYFIDNRYMYMHTLLQHMHTLDLLLNYNGAFEPCKTMDWCLNCCYDITEIHNAGHFQFKCLKLYLVVHVAIVFCNAV